MWSQFWNTMNPPLTVLKTKNYCRSSAAISMVNLNWWYLILTSFNKRKEDKEEITESLKSTAGRHLKRSSGLTPCIRQDHPCVNPSHPSLCISPKSLSNQLLKLFKDGGSTTSPSNLSQDPSVSSYQVYIFVWTIILDASVFLCFIKELLLPVK